MRALNEKTLSFDGCGLGCMASDGYQVRLAQIPTRADDNKRGGDDYDEICRVLKFVEASPKLYEACMAATAYLTDPASIYSGNRRYAEKLIRNAMRAAEGRKPESVAEIDGEPETATHYAPTDAQLTAQIHDLMLAAKHLSARALALLQPLEAAYHPDTAADVCSFGDLMETYANEYLKPHCEKPLS